VDLYTSSNSILTTYYIIEKNSGIDNCNKRKTMKYNLVLSAMIISLMISCRSLPKKLQQASISEIGYEASGDSLNFKFENPLHCPLRISAKTSNSEIQGIIDKHFPVTIEPKQDTIISFLAEAYKEEFPIDFSAMIGNPKDSVTKREITLPFREGHEYRIIQAYNGSYSHNSEYSKYAIDFNLKEGDY